MSSTKETPITVAAEPDTADQPSAVNELLAQDTTPWYQKPNLRLLYLCLIPAALGVEMTTGYDGSVLNGLQAVDTWQEREFNAGKDCGNEPYADTCKFADFGHPDGAMLGVTSASYNLGGLISLPFVPFVIDKIGRRHSITLGSIVLVIGTALQASSVNSKKSRAVSCPWL